MAQPRSDLAEQSNQRIKTDLDGVLYVLGSILLPFGMITLAYPGFWPSLVVMEVVGFVTLLTIALSHFQTNGPVRQGWDYLIEDSQTDSGEGPVISWRNAHYRSLLLIFYCAGWPVLAVVAVFRAIFGV